MRISDIKDLGRASLPTTINSKNLTQQQTTQNLLTQQTPTTFTSGNEIFLPANSTLNYSIQQPIFLPSKSLFMPSSVPMPLQYFYATSSTGTNTTIPLTQTPIFFNGNPDFINNLMPNQDTMVYNNHTEAQPVENTHLLRPSSAQVILKIKLIIFI